MSKYGLIISYPEGEDYLGGISSPIPRTVLQENGQWDDFIPLAEYQAFPNFEPSCCVSMGTLNAVETLLRRLSMYEENFSDRWLAWNSGTTETGNSPQVVAEYLRKAGTPKESDWPLEETPPIKSFEEFYKTPPAKLTEKARQFLDQFEFKHEYVNCSHAALMEALKYSPLGFSVYAWVKDGDKYVRPNGQNDNHWTMCFGYVEGKYWKIFDSYDSAIKHVDWYALPTIAKRYYVKKKEPQKESLFARIRRGFRNYFWEIIR